MAKNHLQEVEDSISSTASQIGGAAKEAFNNAKSGAESIMISVSEEEKKILRTGANLSLIGSGSKNAEMLGLMQDPLNNGLNKLYQHNEKLQYDQGIKKNLDQSGPENTAPKLTK